MSASGLDAFTDLHRASPCPRRPPGAANVTAFFPPRLSLYFPAQTKPPGPPAPLLSDAKVASSGSASPRGLHQGHPRLSWRGSWGAVSREPLGRRAGRSRRRRAPHRGSSSRWFPVPGGCSSPQRGASGLDALRGLPFARFSPGGHPGDALAAVASAAPVRRHRRDP